MSIRTNEPNRGDDFDTKNEAVAQASSTDSSSRQDDDSIDDNSDNNECPSTGTSLKDSGEDTASATEGNHRHTGTSLIERVAQNIAEEEEESKNGEGGGGDNTNNNKRSRRLALNRASARERRKRKSLLIDNLQKSVDVLTEENHKLRQANKKFRAQTDELTAALATLKKAASLGGTLEAHQKRQQQQQLLTTLLQAGSINAAIPTQPSLLQARAIPTVPTQPPFLTAPQPVVTSSAVIAPTVNISQELSSRELIQRALIGLRGSTFPANANAINTRQI